MKIFNILFAGLLLTCLSVNAQQIVSISPNLGQQGQTLTALITGNNTIFQGSSPNGNILDLQLLKFGYDTIFTDTSTINIIDNTHFNIDISIPGIAQKGLYDVAVKYAPWGSYLILQNGFRVGTPDGTLSGNVYYDTNGNGVKDGGEPPLANEKLYITPDNIYVYTDSQGDYFLDTYNGSRTVQWEPTPAHVYLLSSANPSYTVTINNNNSTGNDFGLKSGLTSIIPNQANAGQTLTTTITSASIFVQTSSPVGNILDVEFELPGIFTISTSPSTYNVLHSDTLELSFSVSGNAPAGIYDLHVTVTDPNPPYYNTYILPSSFTVGSPDGYVSGTIYFDSDTNGVKDPGEFGLQYSNILLTPENSLIYPDASGNYSYGVSNGSHTVEIGPLGEYMLSSPDTSYTVTVNNNTASALDFGIRSHLYSITPDQSFQGQSLMTTITGYHTQFQSSSPQGTIFSMTLNKSGGGYSIPVPIGGITPVDSIHFDAFVTIPVNADTGYYDVSVLIMDSIFQWVQYNYILPRGFHVAMADGFIYGTVYFDADSNKIFSTGDVGLANERVLLTPDNIYAFTDTAGGYVFGTYNGVHNVAWDPLPGGYMTLFSDSSSYSIAVNNNTFTGLDFGLKTTNGDYASEIIISNNLPRCNQNVIYYVSYRNISNNPTNGTVSVIKAAIMNYISAVPAPDLVQGDTLTWNYSSLLPFISSYIQIIFHLPGPNNTILTQAIIHAVDGGNTVQFSDTSSVNPTTVCSFDPNDKAVVPEGEQSQHYTLFGDTLDYMIRFQNTGNDTAFIVVIIDTLSADLDLNTFEVIASSHAVSTELRPGGIVRFTFNHIMLPDSNVNEPASHGFVRYIIRAKQGLPANTIITNTADIFFDQNAAVGTNSTTNTMVYVIPVGIYGSLTGNDKVVIYPNPFDNAAILKFNNPRNELYTLCIYNTVGGLVRETSFRADYIIINKQQLSEGIYFYRLKDVTEKNSYYGKFIVK